MKKIIVVIVLLFIGILLHSGEIWVRTNHSGTGWWKMDNLTNGNQIQTTWANGMNFVTDFYNADVFTCYGESNYTSDMDSGSVIPIHNYTFVLDLIGEEPEPDPEPNNE